MAWDNNVSTAQAIGSVNTLTEDQKRACHVVVGQQITDDPAAVERVRAILGV